MSLVLVLLDRRAVRHRHVLDDAPQPDPHHRRRRADRQRRQPAAHRRRQPAGSPTDRRQAHRRDRPDPAGAGADGHRDRLRAAGLPARARVAELDARTATTTSRTTSRTGCSRPSGGGTSAGTKRRGEPSGSGCSAVTTARLSGRGSGSRGRRLMNRLAPLPTVVPLLARGDRAARRCAGSRCNARSASSRSRSALGVSIALLVARRPTPARWSPRSEPGRRRSGSAT